MEVAACNESSVGGDGAASRVSGATPPAKLGDFRIIREIGRGGMGVVYEAEQESLGRHVALKVLSGSAVASRTQQSRFEREAKAAAKLHHTNIVPVFGVGQADGHHFYIMQYISGLALDDVLAEVRFQQQNKSRSSDPNSADSEQSAGNTMSATVARSMFSGRFDNPDFSVDSDNAVADSAESQNVDDSTEFKSTSVDSSLSIALPGGTSEPSDSSHGESGYWMSVARIGVQVAEALAYAHSQGIIHRDIKPANLLLDMAGTIWVADFGLASLEDHQNLTRTGDIIGTLRYMPPESFSGKRDPRGDIYSLGLTLYEMVAMQPAIRSNDRNQTLKLAVEAQHTRLNQINSQIPRDLQTIIHKAISREPELRYQSAEGFSQDLHRYLRDEPIHARQAAASERLIRWARRNPVVSSLSTACVILLLSLVGAFWYAWFTTSTSLDRIEAQAAQLETEKQKAIEAGQAEFAQKNRALDSQASAQAAQLRAQRFAKTEAEARAQAEANLYIGQIALIQREYAGGNIKTAKEMLAQCPPPLRGWEWDYLRNLVTDASTQTMELKELSGRCGLDVSPDGNFALVYALSRVDSRKGIAQVLNVDTREVVCVIENLSPYPTQGRFMPDGKRVVLPITLDKETSVSALGVFDAYTGELLDQYEAFEGHVRRLAISPDGNVMAGIAETAGRYRDRKTTLALFDLTTKKRRVIAERSGNLYQGHVEFSPDGKILISSGEAGSGGEIAIRDSQSGMLLRTIKGSESWSTEAVRFSNDGQRIASVNQFGMIAIHDVATAQRRLSIYCGESKLWGVDYSSDGKWLVSAHDDRSLKVWDADTGELKHHFRNENHVRSIRFLPGRDAFMTASKHGKIRIWDTRIGPKPLEYDPGSRLALEGFTSDGSALISLGKDKVLAIDVDRRTDPRLLVSLPDTANYYSDYRLTADGNTLVRCYGGNAMQVINVGNGDVIWSSSGNQVFGFAVDRGANWLAIHEIGERGHGYDVRIVALHDQSEHKVIMPATLELQRSDRRLKLQFDWSGERLFLGDESGNIAVVDTQTGSISRTLDAGKSVRSMSANPDVSTLAVAVQSDTFQLFDLNTGKLLRSLVGHTGTVDFVAFHPDGQRLASAAHDCDVRFWDPITGRCMITLRGHRHTIQTAFAFSANGTRLMSQDAMHRTRIWDATPDPAFYTNDIRGKAEHEYLNHDFEAAVQDYTKVIEADASAEAYIARGLTYVQLENWSASRADYEQAIKLGKDDHWTQFRPAYLSAMQGDALAYTEKRDALLEQLKETDRASLAIEAVRLCQLFPDDVCLEDARFLRLKELAVEKTNPKLFYLLEQARYAFRTHQLADWRLANQSNAALFDNAMMNLIVTMDRFRNQPSASDSTELRSAILGAESHLADTVQDGVYRATWHGLVTSKIWIAEAKGML